MPIKKPLFFRYNESGVFKLEENRKKPNRIAELRRKHGISQEKLAERLNVTQASVSLYERSRNIPTDILIEIARYFEVTVDYLLMTSSSEYNIPITYLSVEEDRVLRVYRSLPTKYRKMIDELVCIVGV